MANSRPYFLFKPVMDEPYLSHDVEEKLEYRKKQLEDALAALRADTKQRKERQNGAATGGYEEECLEENSEEQNQIRHAKVGVGRHSQLFKSNPEQYTALYNQFGSIMDELALNGSSFIIDPSTISHEEKDSGSSAFDMSDEELQRIAKTKEQGEISTEKLVEDRMEGGDLSAHYQQARMFAQKGLLEEGVTSAAIEDDGDGNLSLKISLLQPAGTSFSISNGMVSFDASNMSEDQMKAMIEFLQRHGLPVDTSSLKLENAGEETQQLFDNVVEKIAAEKKEEDNNMSDYEPETPDDDNTDDDSTVVEQDMAPEEDKTHEEPHPEEEKSEKKSKPVKARAETPKGRTPEELHKQLCDAIRGSWNKFGEENFKWRQGYSVGGWTTFTLYDSDSLKIDRHEADINGKNKDIKINYSRKYWARVHKGRLEFAYTGKMGDGEIYEFVSQLYGCKVKYVRFEGIPEEQESKLREACGKRLIIPVGHKITAERYNKMADAAGKKYGKNSPEYHRYRYDLVLEMRRQLKEKGIDNPLDGKNRSIQECREIRWAEAAYRLYPFRNMWEDYGRKKGNGLRYLYEQKLNDNIGPDCSNGATKVIGAKLAFARLFDMYEEYGRGSIAEFVNNPALKPNEKAALKRFVEEHKIDVSKPVHCNELTKYKGMDPLIFEALYEAMCETGEATAEAQIKNVYFEKLKSQGRNQDPEQYAVKQCLENAERQIRAIGDVMEKEFGFPRLTVIPGGIPRHDFTQLRKEAVKEGLIKGSVTASRAAGGRG